MVPKGKSASSARHHTVAAAAVCCGVTLVLLHGLLVDNVAGPARDVQMMGLGQRREEETARIGDVPLLPGEWRMTDACVSYSEHRRPFFAEASRNQTPLEPPGQIPSEYGHILKNYIMPEGRMLSSCQKVTHPLAFMATTVHVSNMFHTFHHAVPGSEFFTRLGLRGRADVTVLPMPDVPPFEALEAMRPLSTWSGYYLFLRALGDTRPQEELEAQLERDAKPGWCKCFAEIFGGHAVFNPALPYLENRVRKFRAAVVTGFSMPTSEVKKNVVFSLRRTTRRFVNEEALLAGIDGWKASLPEGFEVQAADLGTLALKDQVAMVATASVLVGMHGQSMALTVLLPTEFQRCALVEIFPAWTSVHDYQDWSSSNGVKYYIVGEKPAYRCWKSFRDCGSVEVQVPRLLEAVRRVASWAAEAGPPPNTRLYSTMPPPPEQLLKKPDGG